MKPEEELEADARAFVTRLEAASASLASARTLTQSFFHLIRERAPDATAAGAALEQWTEQALASGIPEWRTWVGGLRRDWEAVVAALHLPWSNGPTEGQINRLKAVKRQRYGRAGLPLLRSRVLPHSTVGRD